MKILDIAVLALACLLRMTQAADLSTNGSSPVSQACTALTTLFPTLVSLSNTSIYTLSNTYWSARQSELHPTCFISPLSTSDVSATMTLLTTLGAPFSVKGGGHTAFQGGSNSAGGVVVDMQHLTTLNLSDDKSLVGLGAGLRWINVSTALDPFGLAVVGGRVADVGVSGLILGGGISFFSGRYGWACDNVVNLEVVLASGEVVHANATDNTGLYWALRGGGASNFGVVTRFDVRVFEQGDLWENLLLYAGDMNASVVPAYVNLTVEGLPSDPDAHAFLVNQYTAEGGYLSALYQYHATPPPTNNTPAVFQPFESITPVLSQTTEVANISTLIREIDVPYGTRQTWRNIAVSATSAELLLDIYPLYENFTETLTAAASAVNDTTLVPRLIFQSIPTNVIAAMQVNGGNAMGLTPDDGPLMIVQLNVAWENAALDGIVENASAEVIERVDAMAVARGLGNGFVYMNYAGRTQEVQKSYGEGSYERLKEEAGRWDPRGVLGELWTGYFKL